MERSDVSMRRPVVRRRERFRRLIILSACMALTLAGTGCDDGDDTGGPMLVPVSGAFAASSTTPAPDLVRLRGKSASGDMVTIDVVITGPTTSGDLYSFAFDLVLSDPSVAKYVNGTAAFGTALTLSGGQGTAVLVSQSGDRVIVGLSKTGGGAGNGIGGSEETIVSLTFRVLKIGVTDITIAGSPANPQNPSNDPTALDSTGAVINSVLFDNATAQLSGV